MADEPDFAQSRRQLRRARVQNAVQMPNEGVVIRRHRDRLLEVLGVASIRAVGEFDQLSEEQVDSVISLALASVPEPTEDSIGVLLICLKVLAGDGQFARLSALAVRLDRLARMQQATRPYWSATLSALSLALRGEQPRAHQVLDLLVTRDEGQLSERGVPRDTQQMQDLLALAVLRSLTSDSPSIELASKARSVASRSASGAMLSLVDVAVAWYESTAKADPATVLAEADLTFRNPDLVEYVRSRGIATLFPAQIRAIQAGATLDQDRLVALPTSSGKTLLAEFRIAATLTRSPGAKAIYVAPYRLLARQVTAQLANLKRLGLQVEDLGDGYDPTMGSVADNADVLVCTPERLDALVRLASSGADGHLTAQELLYATRVLVFDEMHLISRFGRGTRFEMLLTRLRARHPNMKTLGLSAAAHESEKLAAWLGDTNRIVGARRPTGTVEILWDTEGEMSQRIPRRAATKVGNLDRPSNGLQAAATLLARLAESYAPALAVCVKRQDAENLARRVHSIAPLEGESWRANLDEAQLAAVNEAIEEVRWLLGVEHPLATLMESGIGFHHAGLPTHVLRTIERLAKQRLLRVVCATTTVAEGSDLPFLAVVIPHLNFPGRSRKLERDLYLNIIGRAGRANVSVEGMVFILDSSAPTLKGHVQRALWTDSAGAELKGQLSSVYPDGQTTDDLGHFLEFQGQVLGWLGDGTSYVSDQAQRLAELTFSYFGGSPSERRALTENVTFALTGLERAGFVVAGSPYQLTGSGQAARLSGLSAPTVTRLNKALEAAETGWMTRLVETTEIPDDLADHIAAFLLEAVEVYEHSLTSRRTSGSTPASQWSHLTRFCAGVAATEDESAMLANDIRLMSAWIRGATYAELAGLAPTFSRANALFGGTDWVKRASDAAEYIGKLVYPAAWTWSAGAVLGNATERFPTFIRGAIEYGLPTETGVILARRGGLTRNAASMVAQQCGSDWSSARESLSDEQLVADLGASLTIADARRLQHLVSSSDVEDETPGES